MAAGCAQSAAARVHGESLCAVEGDAGPRVPGVGVADVQGLGEIQPSQHWRLHLPGQRAAGAHVMAHAEQIAGSRRTGLQCLRLEAISCHGIISDLTGG